MKTHAEENHRLATLQLYKILDTAAEKTFDDLTRLAAAICEVPISLVSLVDEDRQWFKSKFGLDASETPRDWAFCDHVIRDNKIMVVEDATKDSRFVDNPLVTGDPSIRFYAGAPLEVKEGIHVGTLCVIDRKPRQLSDLQMNALSVLRDAVVTQLELRRARADISHIQHMLPVCAWCRDIKVEDTKWLPLDEYLAETTPITHGICPSCADGLK